ncbi:alpha-aspartyl dipeptidase-like [Oscarella lobularis]|uniref:alpha-aspartyl dipeptidase-like n=1 Tax=Oscarella lobularis TaxID=121494 RepID=UPI0033132AC2
MSRRLLLLSNSTNHGAKYLEHVKSTLPNFLGSSVKTITFVPYAIKDWDAYTDHVRKALNELEIQVKGVHEGNPLENIKQAQAIFIGGGNTFRLLKKLYEENLVTEIRQRVKDGVPYMGSSAGSNVATIAINTTNDMPIVYPPTFDAIGLVPFNINPHYVDPVAGSTHMGETREVRINEFHEECSIPVLGIREGAFVRVEGKKMTLLGNSAKLFEQGKKPTEYADGDDLSFLLQ